MDVLSLKESRRVKGLVSQLSNDFHFHRAGMFQEILGLPPRLMDAFLLAAYGRGLFQQLGHIYPMF